MQEEQKFTPCEDCTCPNYCKEHCEIDRILQEDVAKIRGEDK